MSPDLDTRGGSTHVDKTAEDRPRTKTRLKGVAPVDASSTPAAPQTIGRYEVVEVIGRGAMGVVYKARDPLLDRIVAVKTIVAPASLGKNVRKAFLERFEREAKAAARIAHPAIVTIFDVGLAAEAPFLVMEYLPGETLADRLDRTRLPLGHAVQAARDLASALGYAHKERIVHRDVKPANVLHAGDTRWKLADFGIARLPDSDLTQIGIFMGTPGYAPPEAIREGRYTVQADVFAWGAVFYELLCGKVPYEGPDTQTTNGYVLKAEPPSPRSYDPSVPEPLAQIALRALAHDPARRFANGADVERALAEAWERCLANGMVSLSAFTTSGVATPVAAPPAPKATPAPPIPPAAPIAIAAERSDRTDAPTEAFTPSSRNAIPQPIPARPAAGDGSSKLMVAAALASAQQSGRHAAAPVARPGVLGPLTSSTNRLWWIVLIVLAAAAAGALAAIFLIH
jgi:serine/threonine-protein kinase